MDEGIAPETVDEAALAFGMPMGPIELADTVGLDIAVAVGKLLGGPRGAAPQADGAGRTPDISARRPAAGSTRGQAARRRSRRRASVPPGLAERLVEPFVAEARAALAEGIVEDADLVDAGAIFGTGFAPFRGGPLHYAGSRRPRVRSTVTAEPVPVV